MALILNLVVVSVFITLGWLALTMGLTVSTVIVSVALCCFIASNRIKKINKRGLN